MFFVLLSLCKSVITINAMVDTSILLDKTTPLEIQCPFKDTSVFFHTIQGFRATAYDKDNNYIGEINNSVSTHIIHFGNNKGKIIVENTTPTSFTLAFSAMVFTLISEYSNCKQIRVLSSGGEKYFQIATAKTISLYKKNMTYSPGQKVCLWFPTPFSTTYDLKTDLNSQDDSLMVFSPPTDPNNSTIQEPVFKMTLDQTKKYTSIKSLFFVWITGENGSGSLMRIVPSIPLFSPDSSDNTLIYFYDSNPSIPEDTRTTGLYYVTSMVDQIIDVSDYTNYLIYCSIKDTSVIIHNKDLYEATAYMENKTLIGSFNQDSMNKVVDFGLEKGYIFIELGTNLTSLAFSGIVYSKINDANGCKGTRVVSEGLDQKYTIASDDSKQSKECNISYVENMNVCIWMSSTSPISYKILGNTNIMHLLNVIQRNVLSLNDQLSVKSLRGQLNYQDTSTNSVLFFLKTNKDEIVQKYVVITGTPTKIPTVIPDSLIVSYSYSTSPRIAQHDTIITNLTVKGMMDNTINMIGFRYLFIYCPSPQTSVIIHRKLGINGTGYKSDGTVFEEFSEFSENRLFDFGNETGYIILRRTISTLTSISVSGIVYSSLYRADNCSKYRIVVSGMKNSYIIASPSSNYYNDRNLSYVGGMDLCIWAVSASSSTHKVSVDSEQGFDRVYAYLTPLDSEKSIVYYNKYSGESSLVLNTKNSILYRWKTDFVDVYRHFAFSYNSESILFGTNDTIISYNTEYIPFGEPSIISNNQTIIENTTASSILHLSVTGMFDRVIDMESFIGLEILCSLPYTSVAILNENGFSAEVINSEMVVIGKVDSSSSEKIIDFGSDVGRIVIKKQNDSVRFLYLSAIVYTQLSSDSYCKESRMVSIGSKSLILSTTDSDYYSVANKTLSYGNYMCVWMINPSNSTVSLNYSVNSTQNVLLVYEPPTSDLDSDYLSPIMTLDEYTYSSGSLLFEWFCNSNDSSDFINFSITLLTSPKEVIISNTQSYTFNSSGHVIGHDIVNYVSNLSFLQQIQQLHWKYYISAYGIIFGPLFLWWIFKAKQSYVIISVSENSMSG